jgi:enoyl-CoA hydratase
MTDSSVLSVERDGPVATLWLDRPAKRNAMGAAFWDDFPRAVRSLDADPDVRAVVIAGRGAAFSAGLDLVEMGPALLHADPDDSDAGRSDAVYRLAKQLQDAFEAVAQAATPSVAAVWGPCVGGGLDLAAACDVRIAARDAVFSLREIRVGIVADLGALQRLPRLIGLAATTEMALTGRDVPAEEALRLGLVVRLADGADATLADARETAAQIAAHSPLVARGVKAVLRASADLPLAQALDHVALWNAAFLRSHDLTEAVTAHLERRDPVYAGR